MAIGYFSSNSTSSVCFFVKALEPYCPKLLRQMAAHLELDSAGVSFYKFRKLQI